jgi:von Willebrand factor type A domain
MSDDLADNVCSRGCTNSKWSLMTTAVTNVLQTTDGSVNWGVKYFPDNSACDASMPPAVGIAPSNGAPVADSLARTAPGGSTPTRDAITFGTSYLRSLTDTNPKFLLLATDGLPNCPAGCAAMTNPSGSCTATDNPNEDAAAEAAVMAAAAHGIKTFVIGIGNVATAQNTLNALAISGGEAQTGGATSYYAATDEAAFEIALTNIVNSIAGCPH